MQSSISFKSIHRYFSPIEPGKEEEFARYLFAENTQRVRGILMVTAFLEICNSFNFVKYFIIEKNHLPLAQEWFYFVLCLVVAACSVLGVVLSSAWRKKESRQNRLYWFLLVILCLVVVAEAAICSYEYHNSAQYTRYVIICVVLPILVACQPVKGLVFMGSAAASFFLTSFLLSHVLVKTYFTNITDTKAFLDRTIVSNIVLFAVYGVVIFLFNYRRTCKEFSSKQSLLQSKQELELLNAQLKEITVTDALTQINNRHALNTYIAKNWDALKEQNCLISVMMMDIDFFKAYNDNFGHQKGDECLKRVADTIKGHFSKTGGILARYGGEEFVSITPNVEGREMAAIAQEIRLAVLEMGLPNPVAQNPQNILSVSIGVAARHAAELESMEECISLADRALYLAKQTGRNRVEEDILP